MACYLFLVEKKKIRTERKREEKKEKKKKKKKKKKASPRVAVDSECVRKQLSGLKPWDIRSSVVLSADM